MRTVPTIAAAAAALALAAGPSLAEPLVLDADPPAAAASVRPTTVAEGLEHPWAVAWLPDGTALVTERPGRLRVLRDGRLLPQPVAGVPDVFASGQGGLLDVSVHPRFAENRLVYLAYAAGTNDANQLRVARAVFDGTRLTDVREIFRTSQLKQGRQHFGSRIAWLPDGTMLVSVGDGGNPPSAIDGRLSRLYAQDLDSHIGKVVRIRDDGTAPPDNPFAGRPGAEPAVWSIGHRNIQALAVDPATGTVWSTEHGARFGDEVNRLVPGANHGWPLATWSREYSGPAITDTRTRPGMADPLVVTLTAWAPSGLAVYRGDRYPGWAGDLFAGGLRSQDVRRIDLGEGGEVRGVESIPIGARVRDVRQGPDGLLYVLTDEPAGRLIRLDPAG
jgi:glucose/arabinose dehydrogenase